MLWTNPKQDMCRCYEWWNKDRRHNQILMNFHIPFPASLPSSDGWRQSGPRVSSAEMPWFSVSSLMSLCPNRSLVNQVRVSRSWAFTGSEQMSAKLASLEDIMFCVIVVAALTCFVLLCLEVGLERSCCSIWQFELKPSQKRIARGDNWFYRVLR